MAKGAFRVKNSFQGGMDLIEMDRITISKRGENSMPLLRKRELVDYYPLVRKDLEVYSYAVLLQDLLKKSIQERQLIRGLFPLIARTMEAINKHSSPKENVIFAFQGILLSLLGYEPTLDRCVSCSDCPKPGSVLIAYPGSGGVVCKRCNPKGSESATLSWEAASLIYRSMKSEPLALSQNGTDKNISHQVWRFYEIFFQYYLEKKIHSYAFIRELISLS